MRLAVVCITVFAAGRAPGLRLERHAEARAELEILRSLARDAEGTMATAFLHEAEALIGG